MRSLRRIKDSELEGKQMIEDFESSLGNALNQMNSIPIEVNPLEIAIKSRDSQVIEHVSDKNKLEDCTKDSEKAKLLGTLKCV